MNGRNWKDIAAELAALPRADRLARLAALFAEAVASPGGVAVDEQRTVENLPPWLREMLAAASPSLELDEADSIFALDDTDYEALASALPREFAIDESELRRHAERFAADACQTQGSTDTAGAEAMKRIRYRGEVADEAELRVRFDIEPLLMASEETLRQRHFEHRDRWRQEGSLVSKLLTPRLFSVMKDVCGRLHLAIPSEVFCRPSAEIRIAASMVRTDEAGVRGCVGITNSALELLDDAELAFLLGRELSRYIFGIHRYDVLISRTALRGGFSVLPPQGESLFLRWQKKVQITLDRAGLLGCQDFNAAARSLLKATHALGAKNLNLDISKLLAQIDSAQTDVVQIRDAFGGDVMLPVRLKALQLFANSEKAADAGFNLAPESLLSDDALAERIDRLMVLARRHPIDDIEQAMMNIIACGGVAVLCADRDPSDAEVKILIDILHEHFTDEPESAVPLSPDAVEPALGTAIRTVADRGGQSAKLFIIARLAEVAFADGAVPRTEAARITEIAQRLGVSPDAAAQAITSAEATAKIIEIRRFAGFVNSSPSVVALG